MARKVSDEASSAMRCAWNLRPSTMNVTSDSVGLFTYCSPRYTCGVGGAGAQSIGAVALAFFASSNRAPAHGRHRQDHLTGDNLRQNTPGNSQAQPCTVASHSPLQERQAGVPGCAYARYQIFDRGRPYNLGDGRVLSRKRRHGGRGSTCGLSQGGGVAGRVCEDGDEDVEALAVDEDGLEVLLAAQARQGGGGAVLHDAVGRVHGVHDLVQHLALNLVLQPL
jgi:hypothetical protein